MYPWENVVPKQDTSLRIVHECVKRGHKVAITNPENLTIRDSVTMAFCKVFEKAEKVSGNMVTFYNNSRFSEKMLPMAGFDAIIMRANPPLDPFVLNFLDSIKDDVFIMNAIKGLREANNKIYTAAYYDPDHELIPATHVSKNINYLLRIIEESDQERMIMKPLDGYGGSGVIVIEKSATQNIRSLLEFYIKGDGKSKYVILQDYIPGASKGDVRVLMLNGEPIGALKRIPVKGDVRSNISVGGTVEKYSLTKRDKEVCRKIGAKLVRDGIYFAGLDLIDGKLIEVNVLSPGTLKDINRLNGVKLQTKIVNFIEEAVYIRERAIRRKSEFQAMVENDI